MLSNSTGPFSSIHGSCLMHDVVGDSAGTSVALSSSIKSEVIGHCVRSAGSNGFAFL